eukprot:SAG31_NODE_7385_length_1703_cov_2.999377_1_plen_36_part_10
MDPESTAGRGIKMMLLSVSPKSPRKFSFRTGGGGGG